MAAVMSMVTLFLSLSLAFGAETGLRIAVTNKGLNYVNKFAGAALRKSLQTLTIPGQSGRDGDMAWSLWNIDVKSISGPNTHIELNPRANGFKVQMYNFGIHLHADWYKEVWYISKFPLSGSIDLRVSKAYVTAVVVLEEKNGRPSVTAQSCSCYIYDIDFEFLGGLEASVFNLFKTYIQDYIRNQSQYKICEVVKTKINTEANEELGTMKVIAEIADRFLLDYGLTRAPTVRNNYIDIASRGAVYWKANRQESPFTAAALPALNEFNKMAYIYITEYFINTFLYVAHVNDFLKYNMTVDNVPIDRSELPNTTGEEQYPLSKLQLRIRTSSAPSLKFNYKTMTFSVVANVGVVFLSQIGEVNPLELRVNTSVTFRPAVVNGLLTASIVNYTFNIAVIKSDIKGINEQTFNMPILRVLDSVVVPRLNELGKQGIDFPVIGIFRLYNTQLNSQTGYLQLATDVEYLS